MSENIALSICYLAKSIPKAGHFSDNYFIEITDIYIGQDGDINIFANADSFY